MVTASGALAARHDQPVGIAGQGGRVTRVLVDAGNWVRAGQVLATIDRSVQAQTAAQLAAQVSAAQANAALAQSNLARAQALVGGGFVSKADLDAKRAARDSAQLAEVHELALALAPSRERRLESASQGAAFVTAIRAAWCPPRLWMISTPHLAPIHM